MGTDDLHHKSRRRTQTGDYSRKSRGTKEKRETFLIVCEGKQTEPNYFRSFPIKSEVVHLDIRGEGKNTISLVQEAVKLKNAAIKQGKPYVQVWCVFDKDSFSNEQFNNAIKLCKDVSIDYAYSNEAFELWYLLHFNYIDTALSREQYKDMLSERLGKTYRKEDPNIYALLQQKGREDQAIQRAKKLEKHHISINGKLDPCNQNPSTNVFKLVEILNKFVQ
ncbi:RloB family protein [Paenibacillus sp. KS-LC4]|uniref:RloB family protein n=1 Tax=Paenibacillus sp. KS-LC4 TaxID=2979727 RepID=UPI0030CDBBFB